MEKSNLTYHTIEATSDTLVFDQVLILYNLLFEDANSDFFSDRLHTKEDIVLNVCYKDDVLIGFKVGYRYSENTFYSWVGGVIEQERNKGIAQKLMELQHASAKEKGYQKVRTKSMNRFKPMMILNLKNGFDIVQVYTNESQQTKIVFEKTLV
jgi:predicted GNAT superfamily acetyltransferase